MPDGLHDKGSIKEQVEMLFAAYGSDTEEVLLMTAVSAAERLARLLMHKSESTQAILLFRAALRLRILLQGATHKAATDLLGDLAWLAIVRKKYKHTDGAVALLKQGIFTKTLQLQEREGLTVDMSLDHRISPQWVALLAAIRKCCAEGSALAVLDHYLPALINRLGVALSSIGQPELAEKVYATSIEAHEAMFGRKHPSVATVCSDIGSLLLRKMQMVKRKNRRKQKWQAEHKGQQQQQQHRSNDNRGADGDGDGEADVDGHESDRGDKHDGSEVKGATAAGSGGGGGGGGDDDLREPSSSLDLAQLDTVDALQAEALRWLNRGLAIRAATLGTQHPFYATSLFQIADVLMATPRWREAGPLLEEVVRIRTSALGEGNRQTGTARRKLQQWKQWHEKDA